jgi:hypothetical protein
MTNEDKPTQGINRRDFLERGVWGAGLVVLGGSSSFGAQAGSQPNPFAFDLGKVSKTDPKLVRYEEIRRFAALTPEPRRITTGSDGNLYIAGGQQVTVLSPDGQHLKDFTIDGPVGCVAAASDGTFFAGVRDHVEVLDKHGAKVKSWEAAGKKSWFTAIAVGENDVFVADAGNRVVLRYDKSGKLTGRIGEKNKDASVPGLIVPSPYLDVEISKDGLLRVNNPGRHCVELYTVDGELELSWGRPSAAIDGFCGCCNPISISALPGGGCVTCEKGVPRVKVYNDQGAFECVVAGAESFPENMKAGGARRASDGMMGGLDTAVDAQGHIYILDLATATIRVMQRKA